MTGEQARRAGWVAAVVVVLGVASLLTNITTTAQLSGEDQTLFAVRRTASLLLNSGTVWAGISVLAGVIIRRPVAAALAGLLAGSGALVVHYGVGELTGLMPAGSFASNTMWFVAALVTGAPLGLLGAAAASPSRWAVPARLVVPAAALAEPVVAGWWGASLDSPAVRLSDLAAACLLTVAGAVGGWWVLRRR